MATVGIVGCGAVTHHTLPQIAAAGLTVSWVVDPDGQRRADRIDDLRSWQAPPDGFADLGQALRRGPGVDGVIINSPAGLHLEHVEQVAPHGLPMLVAKPLATSFEDAVRAMDLADTGNAPIAVAEQYPFYPHALAVKRAIRDRMAGEVDRIAFDHRKPRSAQSSLSSRTLLGVEEFAVHHFAVFADWLNQVPQAVSVDAWSPPWSDYAQGSVGHGWVRYERCHVEHAFGFSSPRPIYRLAVEGAAGVISAEGLHFAEEGVVAEFRSVNSDQPIVLHTEEGDAWTTLLQAWARQLEGAASAVGDRAGALGVMALVDAASRSARDGQVVEVATNPLYSLAFT